MYHLWPPRGVAGTGYYELRNRRADEKGLTDLQYIGLPER